MNLIEPTYQMALNEFAAVIHSGRFPRPEGFAAAPEPTLGAGSHERVGAEPHGRLPSETIPPADGI
jgi:hypothetical protein